MSAAPGVHTDEANSHHNSLAVASAGISDSIPNLPMEGLLGAGLTLGAGYLGGMFGIPYLALAGGALGFFIVRFM